MWNKAINYMIELDYHAGYELVIAIPQIIDFKYRVLSDDGIPEYQPSIRLIYQLVHIDEFNQYKRYYYTFRGAVVK